MRKDLKINALIIVLDFETRQYKFMGQLDYYFYKTLCELSDEENSLMPVVFSTEHYD